MTFALQKLIIFMLEFHSSSANTSSAGQGQFIEQPNSLQSKPFSWIDCWTIIYLADIEREWDSLNLNKKRSVLLYAPLPAENFPPLQLCKLPWILEKGTKHQAMQCEANDWKQAQLFVCTRTRLVQDSFSMIQVAIIVSKKMCKNIGKYSRNNIWSIDVSPVTCPILPVRTSWLPCVYTSLYFP